MKQSNPTTRARQQRTTVLWAVGTFAILSVLTLAGWTLSKGDHGAAPAPAAEPAAVGAPAAQAAPAGLETFERIQLAEFKKALDAGEITVIDVRTIEAYGASHIPGSLHIPVSRVEGEIPWLPKGKPIVTYCSCPAEESSGEAAMILVRGGVPTKALQGGFDAWLAAGYPTASGLQ